MKIQFSFFSLTLIIVSLFVPSCFSRIAWHKKEIASLQDAPTPGSTSPQSPDSSCPIENPTSIASKDDESQVTTKDESSYFHNSLVKLFDGNSAIGVQDVFWLIVAPASLTMLFTWVVKKGSADMASMKISKWSRVGYFTLAYVVVLYVRAYFASLSVTATAATESSEEDKQDSLAQTEMSLPSFLFFFIHFLPALKADGTPTGIIRLLLGALVGTTTVLTLFKIAVLSDNLYFNYLFLYLVVGLFFYTFSFKSAASRWFGLVVTWTQCSFSCSMVLLDALLVLYQLSKSSFVVPPSESKDKTEKQKDLIPTLVIALVFAFVLFAKRFSSLPHIVLNVARAILFFYPPSQ